MTASRLLVIVLAAALVPLGASPALAHGLGGRVDLPVPRELFVYGAATAVVLSFVALGALWRTPRLEGRAGSRPLPDGIQRALTGPVTEATVRALSLAVFVVVIGAGAAGDPTGSRNLAPVFVYVWFWVGLAVVHALLGNLWATLSPWDTLARLLNLGDRPRRPYPEAWGKWPAAILLSGFVWMELVHPSGAAPRMLAVAALVYTAITLAGMAVFGRDAWNRNGEAFAVYFGLLSRIAPLARRADGTVILRPFLGGLPSLAPQPGLVAFVMVAIGSTTFDGFSSSSLWLAWVDGLPPFERALRGTAGLLGMIAAMALFYAVAMGTAAAVAGTRWHPLAVRFVHSLVPIAFAYAVAHYFSLLVLEGQLGVAAASDPFGSGWDLLGTARWTVNLTLVSATAIWYVQVASIVVGHMGGVLLAHDRSVALFPAGRAIRTQYALLAVMVAFTVAGLLILSGG